MSRIFAALGLCCFGLFGQGYQFQQTAISANKNPSIPTFTTSPGNVVVRNYFQLGSTVDSTLQVVQAQPFTGLEFFPGTAYTLSPDGILTQAGTLATSSFQAHNLIISSGGTPDIMTLGFSGKDYIGNGVPTGPLDLNGGDLFGQNILTRIGGDSVCSGYVFDGAASPLPQFWQGPTVDSAKNVYFADSGSGGSTIYQMLAADAPLTTGTCKFRSVAHTNRNVLRAYPTGDGRFIALVLGTGTQPTIGLGIFDVVIIDGNTNTTTVLISAQGNAQIVATGLPDLACKAESCVETYNRQGNAYLRRVQNGVVAQEVEILDSNRQPLKSGALTAVDINGTYALIGVGDGTVTSQYVGTTSLWLVNMANGDTTFVLDESTQLPGGYKAGAATSGFIAGSAAVMPDATVYVTTNNGNTITVFKGTPPPQLPVISFSANPQSVNSGGNTTLNWNVTGAASVTIAPNIGSKPPVGSQPVSPIQTTTYTLTATGLGGTTTASVTVTVTQPVTPPPVITSVVPATLPSGQQSSLALVPGGLGTVFGTDLCGVVSDNPLLSSIIASVATTRPLPYDIGRCRITIDGQYVPIMMGITFTGPEPRQAQANFQIPQSIAPGTHLLVVERRAYSDDSPDAASAPFPITVAAFNPTLFSAPALNLAVILQDNSDKLLVTAGHPARPGSIVIGYGTGLGTLQVPIPDGVSTLDIQGLNPTDPVTNPVQAFVLVKVSGQLAEYPATILYAGASPQFVGVNQLDIQIPADIQADPDVTTAYLVLEQGEVTTPLLSKISTQTQKLPFAFNPFPQQQ